MTDMLAPLESGESYMKLFLDADEAAATLRESEIRIYALNEVIRRAEAAGLEITRGPEIIEYHRAEYPGDQFWITTIAVGRRAV